MKRLWQDTVLSQLPLKDSDVLPQEHKDITDVEQCQH
jgi:hypothetical protein